MRPIFILTLTFASLAILGGDAFGQSKSKMMASKPQRQLSLGQVVPESSRVSFDKIDHSVWHWLLQKYVDQSGGVNYAGLKASAEDSAALDAYISTLSSASLMKPADKNYQKAFWINAYNAVTVKGILQEYPTKSIRNHTSETGGYNIWKNLLLNVGGSQISLDAIEHKALRPMGDPRIHFAIVCASKGCPRLLNEAYVGDKVESQLAVNAQHFFSLEQNFQHDLRRKSFKLSAIMQWFGSDFGHDKSAQLKAIAPYLPTEKAQAAANSNAVRISFLDYSWELNEQPKQMEKQMAAKQKAGQMKGSHMKGTQTKQKSGSGRR